MRQQLIKFPDRLPSPRNSLRRHSFSPSFILNARLSCPLLAALGSVMYVRGSIGSRYGWNQGVHCVECHMAHLDPSADNFDGLGEASLFAVWPCLLSPCAPQLDNGILALSRRHTLASRT